MKSIRSLLWVLWGLGWVIVPLILSQLREPRLIPTVMFGSLAALFVVTWHKGAVIRAALHALAGEERRAEKKERLADPATRHRIEVGHDQQVRVHTAELGPAELVGQTDLQTPESPRKARALERIP